MSSLCFIYKHISYKHFFLEKSIPVVYRDTTNQTINMEVSTCTWFGVLSLSLAPKLKLETTMMPVVRLSEWCNLPSEVLRLQCNNSLNLSSRGGRNTLAIRLFQHFNTNSVNFTAPAALLPEDTVPSGSISTSPLAKRQKWASQQTSASTSTR